MPRSKSSLRDEELRANAEPYDWSTSRLTDEEVKEFALGIYRNEIFTEMHVAPHDKSLLGMIFLPLSLGSDMDPETRGAMEKSPPGMCYARMNSRNMAPRSINGYPIFWSCAFLSREDTDRVQDKFEEIRKVLDAS